MKFNFELKNNKFNSRLYLQFITAYHLLLIATESLILKRNTHIHSSKLKTEFKHTQQQAHNNQSHPRMVHTMRNSPEPVRDGRRAPGAESIRKPEGKRIDSVSMNLMPQSRANQK